MQLLGRMLLATLLFLHAPTPLFAQDEDIEITIEEIPTPGWILNEINFGTFIEVDSRFYNQDQEKVNMEDIIAPLPLPEDPTGDDTTAPLPLNPDDLAKDEDPIFGPNPGTGEEPPTSDDPSPYPPFEPTPGNPGGGDFWNPGQPGSGGDFWPPIGGGGDIWNPPGSGGGLGSHIVIIDQIVNLGYKVWKIVAENQPVIDLGYKYANAIPKGIEIEDLEFFSSIQERSFRLSGKNGFGFKVFDIEYTLVHRYGGKYRNKGHFLERVSVVPHKVEALWGYKINFNVLNVSVANVGSKADPIASMGMDAQLDIGTVVKKSNRRMMFEFRGDSQNVRRIGAE